MQKAPTMSVSLIATLIGHDRPGIVSLLADVARRFDANWAESRMASLAGQFAGLVHFEVPAERSDALAQALRALGAQGLEVVIARGEKPAPTAPRIVELSLVGHDRPGIVRDLSASLARHGVSIDELHTEVVSAPMSAEHLFRMTAALAVPAELDPQALRRSIEALANEMMVDVELRAGDEPPAS